MPTFKEGTPWQFVVLHEIFFPFLFQIAREKEIAAAQLAGKPAEMIEKIVMGKINKRYTEVCLMDQPWIMDDKSSLAKLYKDLKVKRFARWEIGEEL